MKGITSVIAIILLLLITIAAIAGLSFFFTFNTDYLFGVTENSLSAQKERSSSVIKIINSTENMITVKNLGSNPVEIEDISIIGGGDILNIINNGTIDSGESAILITENLTPGTNYSLVGSFVDVSFVPKDETPTLTLDYTSDSIYCTDSNSDGDYLDQGEASFPGTGVEDDPYQIFSPCQLHGVRNNLSASYELMVNIDINGFDGDPDSTGNWVPIGGQNPRFTGTFDGNDNTISNIFMNLTQGARGFFGSTGISSISNVGITNITILVSPYAGSIGALVGINTDGNISNSYSTGNISGGRVGLGGLVGSNDGLIENSYSSVNIKNRFNNISGGLVGLNDGLIDNSYATGDVDVSYHESGGLVGRNTGTINNSYATGDVNASNHNDVGGLVGRNIILINNSYSTGNVNGNDSVGGLVGFSNSFSFVYNSHATGNVSGNNHVSGLIGLAHRLNISDTYSTGNINSTGEHVGGIIGFANTLNLSNSYATGNIIGIDFVGGLVGSVRSASSFTNSYATGNVDSNGSNVNGISGDIVHTLFTTCDSVYWDIQTTGIETTYICGDGKTTSELQTPTSNTGIYENWSIDAWNFGTSSEYPGLREG